MFLRNVLIIVALLSVSLFAYGNQWTSSQMVNQVYINEGAAPGPAAYCRVILYDGSTFFFDVTTNYGKEWYNTLMTAAERSEYVQIRYITTVNFYGYYQINSSGGVSSESGKKVLGVAVNR